MIPSDEAIKVMQLHKRLQRQRVPIPDCQCNQCQARKRAIATYNELKAIKDAARYSPEAAGTTASQ